MDPVTAVSNAIAAFFTFASTPAGQKIIADIFAVNVKIAQDIAAMISHVGAQASKQ